ncbi:hypothetical protein NKI01_08995 [Mesorhizobium sp. M0815]|uniref:hypothetical protein n=1 Tax=Mesorhizobium sp. M0815 TaxID=2957005 RepID=UPI00333D21DE
MNSRQGELLQLHGLTEKTLPTADPNIRLEFDNRKDHVDAPEPVIELNVLQKDYLGGRPLSQMTESDQKNMEWLGTLKPKAEEPAEVPVEEPKTSVRLVLDGQALWANAHPDMRLAVYEAWTRYKANPARASESDRLMVEPWLRK